MLSMSEKRYVISKMRNQNLTEIKPKKCTVHYTTLGYFL